MTVRPEFPRLDAPRLPGEPRRCPANDRAPPTLTLAARSMTHLDRILHHVLHDPWTSRIFLAFTVGLFLSCSAEFAAGQESPATVTHRAQAPMSPIVVVMPESGQTH